MPDSTDHAPELRLVVDNSAAFDRVRDIFLHARAVEKDPDGEHLWLLLDPPQRGHDTPPQGA